jgi:hypothetical protein
LKDFIKFYTDSKESLQNIVLNVNGYDLNPKRIFFLPIVEEEKLYIQIFSEHINEKTKNNIGYGCLMLLDNIIGEYACVKKVDGYEYYNLKEATDYEKDLKPLIDIGEYLDYYYKGK